MLRKLPLLGVVLALIVCYTPLLSACTSVIIKTADNGYVYGRTLEFALNLHSSLIIVPPHSPLTGTGIDGQAGSGLAWTSKYAVTGANAFGLPILLDGVNEKGLAGGLFNFPGYAEYPVVTAAQSSKSIAAYELLLYLLSNYQNVQEVKENLPNLLVNNSKLQQFANSTPQVHFSLHDLRGQHIVIEYTKGGKLTIYDNPTGVLTNAPSFDWHLINLSWYQAISPNSFPPIKTGDLLLTAPSSGASMLGLPGDATSSSRFIRAYFFSSFAPQTLSTEAALVTVGHIMNNFDLPPGSIRTTAAEQAGGGVNGSEITEWTSLIDLKNTRYYIKTQDNENLRMVDLSKIDRNTTQPRYILLDQKLQITDLSE